MINEGNRDIQNRHSSITLSVKWCRNKDAAAVTVLVMEDLFLTCRQLANFGTTSI